MSEAPKNSLPARRIMPLISLSFAPGKAQEAIETIQDADERDVARAELSLFTGRAEDAAASAKPFLVHENLALRLSAHIVYCISSVTLGRVEEVQKVLEDMEAIDARDRLDMNHWGDSPMIHPAASQLEGGLSSHESLGSLPNDSCLDGLAGGQSPAMGGFCADVVRILLHLPEKDPASLDKIPIALPEGARYFLCYVSALREYLRGEYGKAEGIAAAALALSGGRYAIPEIYLHVIFTISLIRQGRLDDAIEHFTAAWELAMPDGLLSPFGEHYVLLSGLNRKLIKPELDERYQEISKYADRYFSSWITLHNSHTDQLVAPGLTKMESTVATLFSRGWSVKEIAKHLGISGNTVKHHLSGAYKKLGVNKREQLRDFLLL